MKYPITKQLRRGVFGLFSCLGLAVDAQALSYHDILQRTPAPQPDVKIAYGKDALQFGELWLPEMGTNTNANELHPVVVLIHGGCWLAELPGVELMWHMADDLRKHGIAVWSIEYRRLGHTGGGYPGTFLDIANGADHLRVIAEKYPLDLRRLVAVGHSAGGHLALWAAARTNLPQNSALRIASPLNINAVVGLAAIPDLQLFARSGAHACGEKTVDRLVDSERRGKEAFRDTSITELLPLNVKQVMFQGVFDSIVPPYIGTQYQVKAKAKGETVEVKIIPKAGHFEMIAPWSAAWKEVLAVIVERLK